MRSPKAKRPRCKQCHGYGVLREVSRAGYIGFTRTRIVTCPRCGGTKVEPRNPALAWAKEATDE